MKTLFITICLVLLASSGTKADDKCATREELIEAHAIILESVAPLSGVITLACDPCSCGGTASECYAYMAERERAKEERISRATNAIERFKKYGLCEPRK